MKLYIYIYINIYIYIYINTTQVTFTITSALQSENDVISTSITVATLNTITSLSSNNTLVPQNVQVSTIENVQTTSLHVATTTPTPNLTSSTYSTIVAFDLNIGDSMISPEMQIKIRNETSILMNIDISRIGSLVMVYNATTGTTQVTFTITSALQSENDVIGTSITVANLNTITSLSSNNTLVPQNVQVSTIENVQTTSLYVATTTPTPSTYLSIVAFDLNIDDSMITPEMQIKIRNETSILMNIDISRIGSLVMVYDESTGTTQVQFTITSELQSENDAIGTSMTVAIVNSIISRISNNTLITENVQVSQIENVQTTSLHVATTTPTPSLTSSTYSTIVAFDLNISDSMITPEMRIKIRNETSMRMNIDISRIGSLVMVYNATTGITQVTFTITSALQSDNDLIGTSMNTNALTSILSMSSNDALVPQNVQLSTIENTRTASCNAGFFPRQILEESVCIACLPGTFKENSSNSDCDKCEVGKYSTTTGASSETSCINCVQGKYSTALGANSETSCTYCARGKYSATAGAFVLSTCQDCTAGKYSEIEGATSVLDCVECEAGKFSNIVSAQTCQDCVSGKYSDTVGATEISTCKNCVAGKYFNTTGASSIHMCKECPAGSYSEDSGAISITQCTKCEVGTFSTTTSANSLSTCKNCDIGKYSSTRGATTDADCLVCPIGKKSIISGSGSSSSCLSCAQGNFIENLQNISNQCQICPQGSWSNDFNRVGSCTTCSPGKYGNEVGAVRESQCIECPFSTFNPNLSSININQCRVCPNNLKTRIKLYPKYNSTRTHNPNFVPSILYGCNAGYYFLAEFCVACPAGTYSAKQTRGGIETCIQCRQGKFNPHEGISSADDCQMCPSGKYHNLRGMVDSSKCQPCMCS